MKGNCPICGSVLEEDSAVVDMVFEGTTFHFCSLDCLKIFQAFPDAYGRGEEPDLKALEDSAF
jgi:YHS domain-containing protein